MVELESKKRTKDMHYPVDMIAQQPTMSKKIKGRGKKGREHGAKSESSKRKSLTKKNQLWIPRVRHNYVPMRNSYAAHTYSSHTKSVPFVCGQSISKTHNIGLKIQETLNAIKQERVKNNRSYSNQLPRVYTHNYTTGQYPSPDVRTMTLKASTMAKRKPVDMNLLKAVFLDLYEELTKMMEDLQELRKQKTVESTKMIETLEHKIKKKEMQISVTMALYKEVMCLRKALGLKPDKSFKTKHLSFSDMSKKPLFFRNCRELQGGDH